MGRLVIASVLAMWPLCGLAKAQGLAARYEQNSMIFERAGMEDDWYKKSTIVYRRRVIRYMRAWADLIMESIKQEEIHGEVRERQADGIQGASEEVESLHAV